MKNEEDVTKNLFMKNESSKQGLLTNGNPLDDGNSFENEKTTIEERLKNARKTLLGKQKDFSESGAKILHAFIDMKYKIKNI